MDLKNTLADGLAGARNLAESAAGAAMDPQFRQDVGRNVRKLGLMPEYSPYGVGAIPTEAQLAKMSWADLLALRKKLSSREDQNAVAPFEHRAYSREFSPDLYSALQNGVGALGYTGAKVAHQAADGLGATLPIGGSRSDPSFREIAQGLVGVSEALAK